MNLGSQRSAVDILGVCVAPLDLTGATGEIASWVQQGRKGYACFTGVHGVMESQRSAQVLAAHLEANLVLPDGMPLVWVGRKLGLNIGRVYGPDLMLSLLEHGLDLGWRHAFYGSSADTLNQLQGRLVARFPSLVIAGAIAPPYGKLLGDDVRQDIELLNEMRANVIWVGLSTPKQEMWMHHWRSELNANALLGVGAAFDFHSGRLPQAPAFLQERGLEWAYRLVREPRRLWKRYFRNNPEFVARIILKPPRIVEASRRGTLGSQPSDPVD